MILPRHPAVRTSSPVDARASGVRGLLVYCADYKCSHSISMSADQADDVRLSDLESLFVCRACGHRGAGLAEHPDFRWRHQMTDCGRGCGNFVLMRNGTCMKCDTGLPAGAPD
jgi:hypothetical protein